MVTIVGCRPVCEDIDPVALPGNNMPPPPPLGDGGIPDFDPAQSYNYPQVVVFNGTIYRANGPIAPGPFDPADWTQLDGSTGGNAIFTQDGITISLSGDGTEADPLTAEVERSGLALWGKTKVFFVDGTNGQDGNPAFDGSILAPFATVGAALAVAGTSDIIQLAPGTYNESLSFVSDVMIQGFGAHDANPIIIRGHHTIGPGVQRIRLKDIQLIGFTGGTPTLTVDGSLGANNLDNVSISHELGVEETVLRFAGNNTNWMHIKEGSLAGFVSVIDPAQVAPFTLVIRSGAEPVKVNLNAAPVTLSIVDHVRCGVITHGAGLLLVQGVATIVKDAGGNSLVSTASAVNGALFMEAVAFIQADGSYGAFQKTGTCPFMLLAVKEDPLGANKAGTNLLGENAKNMHAQYQPVNYFPTSQSIYDHLKAIDEALPFASDGRTVVHEVVISRPGPVLANQIILDYSATKPLTLPAGLPNSLVKFRADPGQSVEFTLMKNDVFAGSIEIDTTSVTFNVAADIDLATGDVFTVYAVADAAFSNVALTLQCLRQLDYVA